ncbi:HAD family hydrolase [Virgibacillus halophilus]|uniref:HAD family hydrolase n=1 Tax=Tigheibacillus halophilus TaxID=361280 RepID=A0ABU5C347_9BACI|nr:HAD family hydrolase [Virgibacillus halophilus]
MTTPPPGGTDYKPLDQYNNIELRPNVVKTLKKIESLGLKNVILSNTASSDSATVIRMLDRLGVLEMFEYVYATQSELDPDIPQKPDEIVFNKVLQKIGVKPKDCIMVGNTWDTDIVGANRAGMHAVWLQNPLVSVRKNCEVTVNTPPWILPVWDVDSVPKAIELIIESKNHFAD